MGNKWKGTFEVVIGGEEYTLRPTFDALCEFEEVAGMPAMKARQDLLEGNYGAKVIPAAIWAGMRGEHLINGQKCPSFRVLGEMLRKVGIVKFQVDALKLLTYAASADDIIESIESQYNEDGEEKKS